MTFVFVLLGLLAGCGIVLSVRNPNRWGWLVCGHASLIVYYLICVLAGMVWLYMMATCAC